MKILLAALLLVCPLYASAGWIPCPGSAADGSTTAESLSPDSLGRQTLCYRFTHAGTTDPPRVDTRRCIDGVDVSLDSDKTAAGANFTKAVFVYQCPTTGAVGVFTDCEKVLVDTTGDGLVDNVELNGDSTAARDAIYNISPTWLAFDVTDAVTTLTAEIKVVCR